MKFQLQFTNNPTFIFIDLVILLLICFEDTMAFIMKQKAKRQRICYSPISKSKQTLTKLDRLKTLCKDLGCTENLCEVVQKTNAYMKHDGLEKNSAGIKAIIACKIYFDTLKEKGFKKTYKFIAAAFLIALKMEEDDAPWNIEWANFLHMPQKELDALEIKFCKAMNYELFISGKKFEEVYENYF